MKGTIYLIPNSLGEDNYSNILPPDVVEIVESLDYFIVENEKTARAFIKRLLPEKYQREINMEILDKYTDPLDLPGFLKPVENGKNVGVISEAGVPCVADPGAEIVSIAVAYSIPGAQWLGVRRQQIQLTIVVSAIAEIKAVLVSMHQ